MATKQALTLFLFNHTYRHRESPAALRTNNMQETRIFKATQADLPGNCLTYEYDNFAWINSSNFREIFGLSRTFSGRHNHVKISFGGKSVYRTVETAGSNGVNKDTVGLSYNSLCDLGCDPSEMGNVEVTIEPVSWSTYLLNQPLSAWSVAQKAALAIFIIGTVVSILINLIFNIAVNLIFG